MSNEVPPLGSAADEAYHAFIDSKMPWLVDGSHSRGWSSFMRGFAREFFAAGWAAASQKSAAAKAVRRQELQPRLVHLIAGLRAHQVEEAMQLLLDYIDAGDGAAS